MFGHFGHFKTTSY